MGLAQANLVRQLTVARGQAQADLVRQLTVARGQKELRDRLRLRQRPAADHLSREGVARAEAGAEGPPATAGGGLGSGLAAGGVVSGLVRGGVVSGGRVADGDDDGVQYGAHAAGDGHEEGPGEVGSVAVHSKAVLLAHQHHASDESKQA